MENSRSRLFKLYDILIFIALSMLLLRGKAFKWEWGSIDLSLSSVKNILLVILILGLLLALVYKKINLKAFFSKPLAVLGVFALTFSFLFSQNKIETLSAMGVLSCFVGFYLLMSLFLKNRKNLINLLVLWSVLSVIVSLVNIAYFSWVAKNSPVVQIVEDFPLWPGKNMQGLFLVLNASMVIGVLIQASGSLNRWVKSWLFFVLLVNLACLTITFSRGAWLAMLAVILFLTFHRPKIFLPLVLTGIIGFAAFAPFGLKGRLFSSVDINEQNVQERLLIWKSSLKMIHDYPLTGVGLGNFFEQYKTNYKFKEVHLEWAGEHAHNLFLHFFAETGILGLLVLLGFFIFFYKRGLRSIRELEINLDKGIVFGAVLALIGFGVYSMVDSTFNGNFSHFSMFHVNLCFMIILAILAAPWQKSRS